jgi:hypothetical protein
MASDGVVFASPNYSFQISALMKLLLDRLGFAFHRPRFFGKSCTSIVVQGIRGGDKIVDYLDFVGWALGFKTVKGSCFTAFDPMTEKESRTLDATLAAQARRFHASLMGPALPAPTWIEVAIFRASRTSVRMNLDDRSCDYRYYRDKGWFEADFFYPARVGAWKRALGRLAEALVARAARKRNRSPVAARNVDASGLQA